VEPLIEEIDRLVALGELGHLPLGGHKTRGAGWGSWQVASWVADDVAAARSWVLSEEATIENRRASVLQPTKKGDAAPIKREGDDVETTHVRVTGGPLDCLAPTLGETASRARAALGDRLTAWWCDPAIDLALATPPAVFGRRDWPDVAVIRVEEAAFYANNAVWRAARTAAGPRWVFIEEVGANEPDARRASVVHMPARLHGSTRFAAAQTDRGPVRLKEWHVEGQLLGFTLVPEER
jgi:hypothetical protein